MVLSIDIKSIGFMALLGCVAEGDPKAIRVYQTFPESKLQKKNGLIL